jgi:hypothetical protein
MREPGNGQCASTIALAFGQVDIHSLSGNRMGLVALAASQFLVTLSGTQVDASFLESLSFRPHVIVVARLQMSP